MAGLVHYMKTNDTRPYLQVQLLNPDGTPQDLTGKAVTFVMKRGGTVKINAAASLVVANEGLVEYRWGGAGNTDTTGEFQAEFVVNGIDTYPKEGYITVIFQQDLA